jgi:hypothetical protein
MAFAFGCRLAIIGEQRSEPYKWYGEVSSADKIASPAPKALSGKRLCRLAGKGGA